MAKGFICYKMHSEYARYPYILWNRGCIIKECARERMAARAPYSTEFNDTG
jgi:hypothetical protein